MSEAEKLQEVVKNELGSRGYVVNVQARRDGDLVVGHLHVTSAETDETVAKLVGAGKMEDLNVCFGIDAEGTFRDVVMRVLATWQGVQSVMPIVVKSSKP
ncbi:MAG TPA: hypothetical protein VEM95_01005 [Thermoplasmata archaeon]|nr:hypothetical protein [Thermoplasmata archaeon]